MFDQRLISRLRQQKKTGLFRNPPRIEVREDRFISVNGKKLLNFASNDYLGLGASKELAHIIADNFKKYGASASSSRLVSGNLAAMNEAEKAYAAYFGYEDALLFSSGYQANLALISTFFEKGDTLVFDKHIHASTVTGLKLCGAAFHGYRHNAMEHLEKKLIACEGRQTAVITESLFSMDGDFLPVEAFSALKMKYGFLSIVDEAHAVGAVGKGGRGIGGDVADIALGTFGKALGLFGAFALLPAFYKEYLLNFASPLIYTTALPEAHAATAIDVLDIIEKSDDKRDYLQAVSAYMKQGLEREGFKTKGENHIIAIEIGNEEEAVETAEKLLDKGIFAFTARFPTVPLGRAILRIGMTTLHTFEDADFFIKTLKEIHRG